MTDSLAERVERGAAWLDSVDPDWPHRIDAATLDLTRCAFCVLGQAVEGSQVDAEYSGFDMVDDYLLTEDPSADWLQRHGFAAFGVNFGSRDVPTDLWRLQIEARSGGTRKLDPLPLADVLPHLPGGAA